MAKDELSHAIGGRITSEQFEVLDEIRINQGMRYISDVVRAALELYVNGQGVKWPAHDFISNEDREKIGVPWRRKF